jgi:hypothetical protein
VGVNGTGYPGTARLCRAGGGQDTTGSPGSFLRQADPDPDRSRRLSVLSRGGGPSVERGGSVPSRPPLFTAALRPQPAPESMSSYQRPSGQSTYGVRLEGAAFRMQKPNPAVEAEGPQVRVAAFRVHFVGGAERVASSRRTINRSTSENGWPCPSTRRVDSIGPKA